MVVYLQYLNNTIRAGGSSGCVGLTSPYRGFEAHRVIEFFLFL